MSIIYILLTLQVFFGILDLASKNNNINITKYKVLTLKVVYLPMLSIIYFLNDELERLQLMLLLLPCLLSLKYYYKHN